MSARNDQKRLMYPKMGRVREINGIYGKSYNAELASAFHTAQKVQGTAKAHEVLNWQKRRPEGPKYKTMGRILENDGLRGEALSKAKV